MQRPSLPIRYKVTLLVCGLLLAGALAGSWMAYVELRRAALSDARDRLAGVTDQLTELLLASAAEMKSQTTDLSSRPDVVSSLRS
ncbi:MAG: hypothetical protein GWM90_32990, partial [Gemmatimonadetes bacterium]|nr:hypothetical protein [Gemmatimonadota bacterium]NIR42165.1 hypothetical protein [Actinomycetota bacterium]NIU80342.1 hypothetical protein [Gammaproteobacteria bacterium]NIQ60128.1 hypothetical protein [Gemmatimonadota bacterium]NIX48701.1 hypothetical protein [Gemmatimonadota bacterium]